MPRPKRTLSILVPDYDYKKPAKSQPTKPKTKKVSDNTNKKSVILPHYTYGTKAGLNAGAVMNLSYPCNDIHYNKPMGHDQYFSLFDHCYVKGGRIKYKFGCNTPNGAKFIINCWVDDNSVVSSSIFESTERCIAHNGQHHFAILGGDVPPGQKDISGSIKYSTKDVTHHGFENVDLSNTSSASPAMLYYFHFEIWNIGITIANDGDNAISWEHSTEFDCLFYDPKELAISGL